MKSQSRRKTSCLLFVILLLVALNQLPAAALGLQSNVPYAPAEIAVFVDGSPLAPDLAPLVEQGRVLAPLRAVAEALGAVVQWREADQSITLLKGDVSVRLKAGSRTAYKNDIEYELEVPPRITSGRTLAPVRWVCETLGAEVAWEENSRKVMITSPGAAGFNLLTANQAEVETDLTDLTFWSFQNRHEEFHDRTAARQGDASAGIKSLYSGSQDMSIRTLPAMVEVAPGTPYAFSVWAKAKADSTRQWHIGVRFYDADNNFISVNDSANTSVTSDWSKLVISGTTPGNAAKCYCTLLIINADQNEIFWWDHARFEQYTGAPGGL